MIDDALNELVASGSPSFQLADSMRILNELTQSNDRIEARIEEAKAFSEREILACGNVLSSIVVKAQQLAEERDRAVSSSMARSEDLTVRFVQGMREDIRAQEAAVQHVLDLANNIEDAIVAINDLTMSSRVLAINARIEAARLGVHGKGFTVIADSLAGLSGVIRAASDKVGSAINAVREGLPSVKAKAASMNDRTTVFIDEVAAQVKAASMQNADGQSQERIASLMELSNEALSHLQFQDPMSQKLFTIVGELQTSKDRVRRLLSGERANLEIAVEESAVGGEPPSGEVMLF